MIIKPNICVAYNSFEYAATTNPEVVATLVELCLGAGANRVRVMDFPLAERPRRPTASAASPRRWRRPAARWRSCPHSSSRTVDIPQGVDLKQCAIYQDALEADLLINVPIAKHHSMARLTLGMKNLMGLIQNRGDARQLPAAAAGYRLGPRARADGDRCRAHPGGQRTHRRQPG